MNRDGPPGDALDGDGSGEERRDRGHERGRAAALERPTLELGLEEARLALQLGAASHDEADDRALERDDIRPGESERTDPGRTEPDPEVVEAGRVDCGRVVTSFAGYEQYPRYRGAGERAGEGAAVSRRRRHGRQHRRGDDHEIAGLEGVEGRDAGLHDPDPCDLTAGEARRAWAGRRQQLGPHGGEVGHVLMSSSMRSPNSRSNSTWRSARPTRSTPPSGRKRAHTRRRGR